jgi:hypothetical protein
MTESLVNTLFASLPFQAQHNVRRTIYIALHPHSFLKKQKKRQIETRDGYSYKPFDDLKCIFIHIPKCAGVSICKALFDNLAGGHTTVRDYQIIFSPKEFREYFTFTIVRNPWDRLVSAFYFLKYGGFDKADKRWSRNHLQTYENFNEFVCHWVNEKNIWRFHHFRPQLHYIRTNTDKLPLDFVGFYENLHNDFHFISRKLGVNASLIKTNSSQRPDYKEIYDEASKKIVADVYASDIEFLGYSFDNSSLQDQLKRRCTWLL